MNKSRLIIAALISLLSQSLLFSFEQGLGDIPTDITIESDSETVKNIEELENENELYCYNSDSSYFAYAKQNITTIINLEKSIITNQITTESNVLQIQFQSVPGGEEKKLFIVTEDGTILLIDCVKSKILWTTQDFPELKLTAAAFNYTGNNIVTGYEDGTVCLYTQIKDSNFFLPQDISNRESISSNKINFLWFSQDNKYLLLGDNDGNLVIWDLINQTEAGRFLYKPEIANGAFFTGTENYILILIDTLTAGVFDFTGELIQKIQLQYAVKRIDVTRDGKTVMIVSNNKKNYYKAAEGGLQNLSNNNESTGAEPNTESAIEPKIINIPGLPGIMNIPGLLGPGDSQVQQITITEDEEVQIENIEAPNVEKIEGKVETVLRYKNIDNIDAGLKLGIAPANYTLTTYLTAQYLTYRFLQPFYFGGGFDLGMGFPKKVFPYIYEVGSDQLPKPKLFAMNIYGTAGICVFPFTLNIEVFTDASLGYTGAFLWNGKIGMYNARSKWYSSLYTEVRVGGGYKGFKGWISMDYEPIFGISLLLGAAYEIKMPF